MKCSIIVICAVVATIQAKPYVRPGLGFGGGYGYGNSGYVGGNNGYINRGYGSGALQAGHDIGHQESDFSSSVRHHQSSSHNIGGITSVGMGGHDVEGYGRYVMGQNGYGNGWNNGII